MYLLITAAAAAVIYLFYYIIDYYKWVATYPRGPTPLPLVGNLLSFKSKTLHLKYHSLSKEFGPVFTVFVPVPIVVFCGYEAIKEAFVDKGKSENIHRYVIRGEDFAHRPQTKFHNELSFCENGGVIMSNGESWKENRRQAISILRDFGMSKMQMEEKVKHSIDEYLRFLDQIKDKRRVDMRWPIQLMVANVINETLFGNRYDYENCKPLMNYVEAFNEFITVISQSLLRFVAVKCFWIRNVPIIGYNIVTKHIDAKKKLMCYISASVSSSMEKYKADEEPTCFVHSYVQKIGEGASPYLTMDQLHATCDDLFLAGTESTTTTIRWGLLLMAEHQDIQERMRKEIHSVCGSSRLPSMADKLQLPYATAVVHEIQRWANILSMNVIRKTQVDTEVMGCRIPAGTLINGDLYTVHACDPIFEEPKEFRPERYLNEDGTSINKAAVERTIPFSLGKRKCAGEGLARVELLLGLAATVQRYRILPTSDGPVDLTPVNKIVIMPRHQPLRLEPL